MEFIIPNPIKKAMTIMKNNGFECFIVGGSVRDFLMEKTPSDFDITTNATPMQTKQCFKDYKVIETGIQHGTVTVLIDREPIEITTFRIDGKYIDNRHPESVEFTVDLEEDLSRRDFTVNALAYDGESEIVDLFFGKKDLKDKVIRCVGEPDKRFNEDGLRILRALRFASVLDFSIDKKTEESIRRNKNLLLNISKERILTELSKLLCGVNAEKILMGFRDVLEIIIPELKAFENYEKNVEALSRLNPEKQLRFSAFLAEAKSPKLVLKNLKSDNKLSKSVENLIMGLRTEIKADKIFIKKLMTKYEFDEISAIIELKEAFGEDKNKCYYIKLLIMQIKENNECVKLSDLEINGTDLQEFAHGKQVGEILNSILNSVIEGETENKKESLLLLARRLAKC